MFSLLKNKLNDRFAEGIILAVMSRTYRLRIHMKVRSFCSIPTAGPVIKLLCDNQGTNVSNQSSYKFQYNI